MVFAGDHGVARSGVSAYPPEVTAQMVLNFLRGGAAVNALARLHGATVRVFDLAVDVDWATLGADVPPDVTAFKVRRSSDDVSLGPALTYDEAAQAFEAGRAIADREIDAGVDLLIPGDMGIGNTTPAATLTAVPHRDRRGVGGRPRDGHRRRHLDDASAPRSGTRRGADARPPTTWSRCWRRAEAPTSPP